MKYQVLTMLAIVTAMFAQAQTFVNTNNVVLNNETELVLLCHLDNNGTIITNQSNIKFTGTANQNINGDNTIAFYKLSIDKPSGDLIIKRNISVTNNLTFVSGDLDLENATIDLTSTGIIVGETESNSIKVGDVVNNTGTITTTRTVNGGVTDFDPANLGVSITTTKDLGTITIVRGHQRQTGKTSGIARYYEIPGFGEITSTNTVELSYWDHELDGTDHPNEANLEFYQEIEYAGGTWWTPCVATINTSANTATLSGDFYSPWILDRLAYGAGFIFHDKFTIGSKDNPLPVELIDIYGEWIQNYSKTELKWQTASEKNNDYFEIYKSYNTTNWELVGKIKGAGNSSDLIDYSFIDNNIENNTVYYKLKQVDYDNTTEFSKIISLTKTDSNNTNNDNIYIYPNPTNGQFTVEGVNIKKIEIIDITGKTIYNKDVDKALLSTIDCQLKKGMYIIKVLNTNGETTTHKLIVN